MEGNFATYKISEVPPYIIETAEKASRMIGNGLYGVDIKEYEGKALVIEVNDNPNIDYGVEDQVLGDELYTAIIMALKHKIQQRIGITQ